MATSEIIVVGAGVVGCSLAFHLARAGKKVTVFDKERQVGAGMSARSGALLRMHYTFAPEAELAWKSLRYFVHWEEMVGRDAERRGCGFVRTGFTIVVGPPNVERLRANVAMLRVLGVDTDLIEPAELRKFEPAINVDDVALAAAFVALAADEVQALEERDRFGDGRRADLEPLDEFRGGEAAGVGGEEADQYPRHHLVGHA